MEKIKKFNLNEGLRFNSKYFTLKPGEHNIDDVCSEIRQMEIELLNWRKNDARTITTKDLEHSEFIPYWD